MGVPARGGAEACLPQALLSVCAEGSGGGGGGQGPIYFGIDCRSERERQLGSFPKVCPARHPIPTVLRRALDRVFSLTVLHTLRAICRPTRSTRRPCP